MHIENPETEEESELLMLLHLLFRCEILHLGKATATLDVSSLHRSFYSPHSHWNPHIPPRMEQTV